MKDTGGNFIDLDSEDEDARCILSRGTRRTHKRYGRPQRGRRAQRRRIARGWGWGKS